MIKTDKYKWQILSKINQTYVSKFIHPITALRYELPMEKKVPWNSAYKTDDMMCLKVSITEVHMFLPYY